MAVVSLPTGVFQPYSGVKTSILILDKALARQTNTIAFFKVENDGFDLGAQRRPINRNDLPRVQVELAKYSEHRMSVEPLNDFQPALGLVVEKGKIALDGEYNLNGERYREDHKHVSQFPIVPLGKVAQIIAGQSPPGSSYNDTEIGMPFYQGKTEFGAIFIGEPTKWTTAPQRFAEEGDILMSVRAPVGPVNLPTQRICIGRGLAAIRPAQEVLLTLYAFYVLRSMESQIIGSTGAAFASITKKDLEKTEIPLPPLDMQLEIVAEIEGYQKVIDGARAVVENYRPRIAVDPEWPLVALGDICEFIADGTHFSPENAEQGARLYITSKNVRENYLDLSDVRYISEQDHESIYKRCPIKKGDVLFVKDGANAGLSALNTLDEQFSLLSSVAVLRGRGNYLNNRYLSWFLNTTKGRTIMLSQITGVAITRLTLTKINQAKIPVPPIQHQMQIVDEIESEQAMVNANRELIQRFEDKIQTTINRVWRNDVSE